MLYCRNCGKEVNKGAKVCTSCGFDPSEHENFCQNCGAGTKEKQKICVKCGFELETKSPLMYGEDGQPALTDFRGFDPYWQEEFVKIQESGENYKGKWNWPAFFFGPIWALTKGCWIPALISILGGWFSYGIISFIYWFVFAIRGNYMYYNKAVKRKNIPF